MASVVRMGRATLVPAGGVILEHSAKLVSWHKVFSPPFRNGPFQACQLVRFWRIKISTIFCQNFALSTTVQFKAQKKFFRPPKKYIYFFNG
jgi:hypothetical protein